MERAIEAISKETITVEHRALLLEAVDIMRTSMYQTNQIAGLEMHNNFFIPLLKQSTSDLSANQACELYTKIEDFCRVLLCVEIVTAIQIPENYVREIFDLLCKYITEPFIIKFRRDASLIGGAVIGFKGYYKDLSLRKRMREYFSEQYTKIMID